jgi:hypothetical protein
VGIGRDSAECVHGSLLVARELLRHTGAFMIPRFKELCGAIMKMKDHKSTVVKIAIIKLIPDLASFCPDAFQRGYLDESVAFLIASVRGSGELKRCALLAIGQLCRTSGSALYDHIEQLDAMIREALGGPAAEGAEEGAPKDKKERERERERERESAAGEIPPEALLCVADMIRGLGTPFHLHVVGLLDTMLQSGLTQELIETLSVISTNLPGQKGPVQERLLEEVTKVLGGQSESLLKPQPPAYTYCWTGVAPVDSGGAHPAPVSNAPAHSQGGGGQTADTPGGKKGATSGKKKSIFSRVFGIGGGGSADDKPAAAKAPEPPPAAFYGLTGGALAFSIPAKKLSQKGEGGGKKGISAPTRPGGLGSRKNVSLAELCGGRSAELVILSLRTLSTLASTQTGVGTPVPDHTDTTPSWFGESSRSRPPPSQGLSFRHSGDREAKKSFDSSESRLVGPALKRNNFGPTPVYQNMPIHTTAAAAPPASSVKATPENKVLSLYSGSLLIQLVPHIVTPLLYCDHEEVRREAVVTTAKLISSYAGTGRTRGPTALLIETALRAIIEVYIYF